MFYNGWCCYTNGKEVDDMLICDRGEEGRGDTFGFHDQAQLQSQALNRQHDFTASPKKWQLVALYCFYLLMGLPSFQ